MRPMKIAVWLTLLFTLNSCGYKVVGWSSETYGTVAIERVQTASNETRLMATRMRDALIERCLAGSGLKPVTNQADLVLKTRLVDYQENIIATDTDGRTQRIQFTLWAHFDLADQQGKRLWNLNNYRYSDQYRITTTQSLYRDEKVAIQDEALRSMADLVITNITLAIAELESDDG